MANITRKVEKAEFGVSNSWLATKFTLLKLSCGHYANWSRPGHDGSNLPTEFECDVCGDIAETIKRFRAIESVVHTRAVPHYDQCGNTTYYTVNVYKLDKTSPTGVCRAMSLADIPEYAEILKGSLSPLSPTER